MFEEHNVNAAFKQCILMFTVVLPAALAQTFVNIAIWNCEAVISPVNNFLIRSFQNMTKTL